ncbi:MAG: nuclear transport factor 2 family protein [Verrucomicrobia bacterium]|nr:nuclear transport factor 2 family protein [Verrucomicrobiota bacterium]
MVKHCPPGRWLTVLGATLLLQACAGGDAKEINRNLRDLVERTAFSEQEKALQAVRSAKEIGQFFTKDVRIDSDLLPYPIRDRSDLVAMIVQIRSRFSGLDIEIPEKSLKIDDSRTSAGMSLVVKGRATGWGDSKTEWKEFDVQWRKTDDGWRISRATPIETIQRP